MVFRLYGVEAGGEALWAESHNAVPVAGGLFSVLLGGSKSDPNPIPPSLFAENDSLWLRISVGGDQEMVPREQLGSAPFAVQALTVPDGSVTTEKIADGSVTSEKLNANRPSITDGFTIRDSDSDATLTFDGFWWSGNERHFNIHVRGKNGEGAVLHLFRSLPGKLVLGYDNPGLNDFDTKLIVGGHALIKGNLQTTGTKSAVALAGEFGQRKLYASESPGVLFFDEGLARLKAGVARVTLGPVFLETIEGDFLVHVTPYGDAALYVAEVGPDYFVVKARDGDPNVACAWRLNAHRKGYTGVRLEGVENAGRSDERIAGSGDDN